MRVIGRRHLRRFSQRHPTARGPLLAWFREVECADWPTPAAVNAKYCNASFLGRDRVVFNVKGNTYRLVVTVKYAYRAVYVRFVATQREYDAADANEV